MKWPLALLVAVSCCGQTASSLEQQFEQALAYRQAHPLALDGAFKEAQLLRAMQRPREAKQIIEQASKAHPESLECLALQAEICEKLNQMEDAKELLARCTQLASDDPTVWKWLGDFELRRKDPAAVISFAKAADLRPDDAQAWAGLAAAQDEAGESAKASLHFEKAAALNAAQKNPSAMIYLLYADHLRNSDNWQPSVTEYNRALAIDDDLALAYFGRGRSLMELGELNPARTDLVHCERDPALRLEAINLLFKIAKADKNASQAERYAREIQQFSDARMKADAAGNEIAAGLARGAELLHRGQVAEAATAYQSLARQYPEVAAAYDGVARTLAATGHYAQAETAIRSYLASAPQDPAAHILFGKILLAQHRAAEARGEFQSAARLDPLLAEARMGEAACDIFFERYEKAVETLRQTVVLPSAGIASRLMLSEALYKNHDRNAALRELDRVLQSEPANNRALQMKQAIEHASAAQ